MLSNVLLNKSGISFLLVGMSLLLTSACTTVPVETPTSTSSLDSKQTWQTRQPELAAIKVWRLSGRVAVSQDESAWNLNLEWQQDGDEYEIILNGPFGAGKVKLIGNAYGVLLRDSDGQVFYADNAQTLLREHTGVNMPVEGLRYWIIGLTSPQQQKKPVLDEQGRLDYLEEANWQVRFKRYTDVSGMQLPNKVFILEPHSDIDVRLVVDNWKLGAF